MYWTTYANITLFLHKLNYTHTYKTHVCCHVMYIFQVVPLKFTNGKTTYSNILFIMTILLNL
jgi:hypothetical protein